MTNIPTELLRTFVTVASVRSFTRAAELLGVTQPAVSAQVKRLQTMLGSDLFDKSAPGVTLTEAGQAVLDRARQLLSLNDQIFDVAATRASAPLRIGIPGDFAGHVLPAVLADFRREFPQQGFRVRSDSSSRLLRGLDHGEIDLAVAFIQPGVRINARHSWAEKVVWIRGPSNHRADAGPVPLVCYDESAIMTKLMIHALEQAGRDWEEVFVSASTISVTSAVLAGLGVSATIERFVPADIRPWPNPPLPPLPEIECGIFLNEGGNRAALEALADAIARVLRPPTGLPAPAIAYFEMAAGEPR